MRMKEYLNDIKSQPLYWATMAIAVAGAFLTTEVNAASRGLGFFLWLFSNGYLLLHFYREKNIPMVVLFVFYELLNMRGVLNNWGWY